MSRARDRIGAWLLIAAAACNETVPPQEGPPPHPERSPCAPLCEHIAACAAPADFPGVDACTRTCAEDPRQNAEPCRTPRIAYEKCVVALPCEQVRASTELAVADEGPCGAEIAAVFACEPDVAPAPFIHFQF